LIHSCVHTRTLINNLPFPVHVAGVLDQNRPGRAFLRPTLFGDVLSLSHDYEKKHTGPPDHCSSLLEVATSSSSVRFARANRGEKSTGGQVRRLRGRDGSAVPLVRCWIHHELVFHSHSSFRICTTPRTHLCGGFFLSRTRKNMYTVTSEHFAPTFWMHQKRHQRRFPWFTGPYCECPHATVSICSTSANELSLSPNEVVTRVLHAALEDPSSRVRINPCMGCRGAVQVSVFQI